MARKSKIEQQKSANPASAGSNGSATDSVVTAKTKAKTTSSSPKKKKAAPKKKPVPSAKPTASKKPDSPAKVSGPSDDEIRIRAYFLAERRLELSLPGDSAHDWIEAKRQLIEEAGPARS